MKRFLALFLIFMLIASILCGCGQKISPADAFAEIDIENTDELLNDKLIKALSKTEFKEPKNIIFMIGDGMGQNIITATETAFSDKLFDGKLAINHLPVKGWSRTRSADNALTDSAAGATALATGYRTGNGVVAMNKELTESYETVLERAAKNGKSTGVVVTKAVTDATPAAFTSHVESRNMQTEIASQQLNLLKTGTLDLLLGGGFSYFNSDNNQALFEAAKKDHITFIDDFSAAKVIKLPLLGLFASGELDTTEKPTLAEMTHLALKNLSQDENGFFLMVEGSQIDTRAHENNIWGEVGEMWQFDKAIAVALNFVRYYPDTVLIITADHETGGLTLPKNLSRENISECTYETGGHTQQNVPVFAIGYGTEKLGCEQNNTDIGSFIFKLLENI